MKCDVLVPLSDTNVRSGGAWTYSGTGNIPLAAATEVDAKRTDTVAVAVPKQVTDGRTVDGGSRVPAGPKTIGGGNERCNNQMEC